MAKPTLSFRVGGYSIVAAAIVIAMAIFINLTVSLIPTGYTRFDLTENQLFTLSDQSKQLLSGLDDDIYIYWIVQEGSEDNKIGQLLEMYNSMSNKVKVDKRDPVVNPSFVSQYTNSTPYNNSVIVVSGERSKYINFFDMFLIEFDDMQNQVPTSMEFVGENALTSAIHFVSADTLPIVYQLKGQGQPNLPSELGNALQRANVQMEDLRLLTLDEVPDDADALIIYSPQGDISTVEKETILSYLQQGGKLLLVTDYSDTTFPNLSELMKHYGAELVEGIVIEDHSDFTLRGYNHFLLPDIRLHATTQPLLISKNYVLMPFAQGIETTNNLRDTLRVTKLLTTTNSSFSKLAGINIDTYQKESGDIDGPFAVGVAVTEDIDEDLQTGIVWLTTSHMFDPANNQMVSGANYDLFINALGWLTEQEETISILPKSLMVENLTVPSATASRLSLLLIGVVPLIFIGTGGFITIKRRRR